MNIAKHIQRITNRTQQAQSIKSDLCLTFNALYRVEQSRIDGAGPVSVHAPRHMLLFVRMLGGPRQSKMIIFYSLLHSHHKPLHYLFALADYCAQHVLSRLTVVKIPTSTWNLHLVNIQRATRSHQWDLSTPSTVPSILMTSFACQRTVNQCFFT